MASAGVTLVVSIALEEPVRRLGVALRGDQHVDDLPELVDGA
jgi:hypothetical protein